MLPNSQPPIEYATKADLRELRLELKADLAEMKTQIAELKADLHKTVVTSMLAQTAIFGTLVTVLKLFT